VNTAGKRLLAGLGDSQSDVESPTASTSIPWSDHPRGDDKSRIWRYLLNTPSGAPIVKIARDLFDVSPDEDETAYQREHRFVTRFVEDAPIFRIDRRQGFDRAEPRPTAFHLRGPKQQSNTDAVGRFDDLPQTETPKIAKTEDEIALNQYPRDFARNFISSRGCTEMTPARAQVIENQFASYLEQIDGRFNILKNIYDEHPEYLLIPYKTLYNSPERVADNWRRYHNAWQKATEEYSTAVQVTLTTDPKKYESLQEMADEIGKNFNRFMSWTTRRLADRCDDLGSAGHNLRECPDCQEYGDRPDYVKALEWTDKGRAHLHIILFGVDWLADKHAISDWAGKYQGEIVDVRGVKRKPVRDGEGMQVNGHDLAWISNGDSDDGGKNEKAHLGKYLAEDMPADESISEIRQRVGDDDDDLWKTALFWATGKQFWSCSEDLETGDGDGNDLDELVRYVFVGAANHDDIPKHVWESSVKLRTGTTARGKDPPVRA
jgi:hypothetical protein